MSFLSVGRKATASTDPFLVYSPTQHQVTPLALAQEASCTFFFPLQKVEEQQPKSTAFPSAHQPITLARTMSRHITREELARQFHLPISEAAKNVGVCATVLKKVCRSYGILRWPQRKVLIPAPFRQALHRCFHFSFSTRLTVSSS